jgi:1-deoxy-D-xylulose-5-phosphate reductoisomerase
VAVEAFLRGKIPFLAIPTIVGQVLDRTVNFEPSSLQAVLGVDSEARRGAAQDIEKLN